MSSMHFLSWSALAMAIDINVYSRGMVQAMGRPIMAVFTGIATGMVSDLRLDKPPHFNPLKEAHAFKPYRFTCAATWTTTERTYEQRRAVLACYIISAK